MTDRMIKYLWTYLCVAVLAVGCSSSRGLTRSSAKRLLDDSPRFKSYPMVYQISESSVDCGARGGLWVREPFWDNLSLTAKGRASFTQILGNGRRGGNLTLIVKRHVVEITGIKEATMPGMASESGRKLVDFTWAVDDGAWPSILKACVSAPSESHITNDTALFTLYDDGWRVGE